MACVNWHNNCFFRDFIVYIAHCFCSSKLKYGFTIQFITVFYQTTTSKTPLELLPHRLLPSGLKSKRGSNEAEYVSASDKM